MIRRKWLLAAVMAIPMVVAASLVYANSQANAYTCPITGEQLPCPNCCPLNKREQQTQAPSYMRPVTGEELPCPNCCPYREAE